MSKYFDKWELLYVDPNLTEFFYYRSNQQRVIIGSGDGSMLTKQQVIAWIIDDPTHLGIYLSPIFNSSNHENICHE